MMPYSPCCSESQGLGSLLGSDGIAAFLQDLVDGFRTCVWQALPEGWEQHVDPCTGRPYFVNSSTGGKTWERPLTAASASKVNLLTKSIVLFLFASMWMF